MSRRLLLALACCSAILLGCGQATTEVIDEGAALAGTYRLTAVNGGSLPALYLQSASGRVEFTAGTLTLRADSSFTESLTLRTTRTDGSPAESNTYIENGTFAIVGTQVYFSVPANGGQPGFSWDGSVSGDVVTYTVSGIGFRFRKDE